MIRSYSNLELGYQTGGFIKIGVFRPLFEELVLPILKVPAPTVTWDDSHKRLEYLPDDFSKWGLCGVVEESAPEKDNWANLIARLPKIPSTNAKIWARAARLISCVGKLLTISLVSSKADLTAKQYFELLQIVAPSDMRFFGIGGTLRGPFIYYLRQQVDNGQSKALSQKITETVNDALVAMWPKTPKTLTKQSNCVFAPDGRFSIKCFGDACDLSIYPDGAHTDDFWQMGCHNIDSPIQLLSLFCGFAKLTELARDAGY